MCQASTLSHNGLFQFPSSQCDLGEGKRALLNVGGLKLRLRGFKWKIEKSRCDELGHYPTLSSAN
jgi:hypothetical protein